ncbi:hypothetical protein PENANT_c056G09121 [Penicillium antarcticum]|uniref:HMG box domain-containing protein n=1 Tax=Penicillium antarcticum TaxID=416450 RepID=A0A1V6PQJ3_9EURO|nr:uncharacterized protein N7508_011142 [Penicillium antarcticum]XP_058314205.1 uncharacterized protein N7508_011167 [Penicillium antarcticum]KAJ5288367.1 hypothetical protein N7508_011142 [Penicillium antarcticum]KAJ5288392.1 hypothetical protein N7508_011167 [Penicillium antarcticum]OQD79268.1 hypothetical protein PENANT_c056G09121 [Penicillium antarcticum]
MARHKIVQKPQSPNELAPPIVRSILCRPLSDILSDEVSVPVRDMHSWVHRSCADRMEEARKKGKITRPMNAFMLYRFAYNGLVKEYLRQSNHRNDGKAISKAIGLGWRNESTIIRCIFQDLANTERHQHSTIHASIGDPANKTLQLPIKRTSPSPITPDTERRSGFASGQSSPSNIVDTISLVLEQPEPHLAQSGGLQWPAVTEIITHSSPVASENTSDPWLGNIPYEYGDLESGGGQDNVSNKLWLELHEEPKCMGYIDPGLLLR